MSNLPGNPHHTLSEAAQTEHAANVHATLALAYEQRTIALIRYIEIINDTDRDTMKEIKARLGLGERK